MRANPSGGENIPFAAYVISRGGFTLRATAFIGSMALAFKLAYIAGYDARSACIRNERRQLRGLCVRAGPTPCRDATLCSQESC